MTLDQQTRYALRAAYWRGRDYTTGGVNIDRIADAVVEVLTPVLVTDVLARIDFDDAALADVWTRVEGKIRERTARAVTAAVAHLEATGTPVGDDPDSIDRALAAALAVPTGNHDEQEQPI